MALEQDASSRLENLYVSCGKKGYASCSLQCRPHLLLVEFENLVQSFFRNEN